jgi:multicomponent Na+:H+ antiporter subunit B
MNNLVLRTAARFLMALLLTFSIFLTLRGHNETGGGFSGGLVAAIAFTLHSLAYGVRSARNLLHFNPRKLIGLGLLASAGSGLAGLLMNKPYLTGQWLRVDALGGTSIGTPLLFDVGVYLVVLGVTLTIVFSLSEV